MTAESIFRVAFWVLFGGVLAMRAYFSFRVRQAGERVLPDQEAIQREGGGMFAARLIMFFLLLAFLGLYTLDVPWMRVISAPIPGWLRWAGFVLGLVSLAFWIWTQAALGIEWSPQLQVREEHHLVTTGPYARVRHPLYTANMGFGVGIALVSANWAFIIFAAVAIVGFAVRVPKEEQMMIQEFGEEYRAYMQRSGKFFPKLG